MQTWKRMWWAWRVTHRVFTGGQPTPRRVRENNRCGGGWRSPGFALSALLWLPVLPAGWARSGLGRAGTGFLMGARCFDTRGNPSEASVGKDPIVDSSLASIVYARARTFRHRLHASELGCHPKFGSHVLPR